jgi:hypothetical protein
VAEKEEGGITLLPPQLHAGATGRDVVIWEKIREGCPQALSELYDQYGAPLYALAAHLLEGDRVSAENVVVDAFVALWKDPNGFAPGGRTVKSSLIGAIGVGTLRARDRGMI